MQPYKQKTLHTLSSTATQADILSTTPAFTRSLLWGNYCTAQNVSVGWMFLSGMVFEAFENGAAGRHAEMCA